jgi:hypothetical protein
MFFERLESGERDVYLTQNTDITIALKNDYNGANNTQIYIIHQYGLRS